VMQKLQNHATAPTLSLNGSKWDKVKVKVKDLEACGVSVTCVGIRSATNSSSQNASSTYTVRNPRMMTSVRDRQKKKKGVGKNGRTPLCETLAIVTQTDEHEDRGKDQGYKRSARYASKEWPIDKGKTINRRAKHHHPREYEKA
jgi:hypothetical protein